VKLDDAVTIAEGQRLGVIKIDIENSEFAALRGARQLLVDAPPIVIFENNSRGAARHAGYTVDEFYDFFTDAGYEVWSLMLQHIRSADEWAACPSSYYLAHPKEMDLGDLDARYGFSAVVDRIVGESTNAG